jgi:P-type E1-E2 ATPase
MFFTFGTVLFFTMLKEAYEDYHRYCSDKELNNRLTEILFLNGIFYQKKWSEVNVGDIIKVNKDQEIPADILLL